MGFPVFQFVHVSFNPFFGYYWEVTVSILLLANIRYLCTSRRSRWAFSWGSLLNSLQYACVSVVLRSAELDCAHQWWADVRALASFDLLAMSYLMQPRILCCRGTFLAHVHLLVQQDSQVFLLGFLHVSYAVLVHCSWTAMYFWSRQRATSQLRGANPNELGVLSPAGCTWQLAWLSP